MLENIAAALFVKCYDTYNVDIINTYLSFSFWLYFIFFFVTLPTTLDPHISLSLSPFVPFFEEPRTISYLLNETIWYLVAESLFYKRIDNDIHYHWRVTRTVIITWIFFSCVFYGMFLGIWCTHLIDHKFWSISWLENLWFVDGMWWLTIYNGKLFKKVIAKALPSISSVIFFFIELNKSSS